MGTRRVTEREGLCWTGGTTHAWRGELSQRQRSPLKRESGVTLNLVASKTEPRPLWRLVPHGLSPRTLQSLASAP